MTTRLIPAVARRLLHDETVTLIVNAALADLRFECADAGWPGRLRAHWSAWVALWLACWYELVWEQRGPAWSAGLAMLANLAFLVLVYHAMMVALMVGLGRRAWLAPTTSLVDQPMTNGLIGAALLACFGVGVGWAATRAHDSSQ